MIDRKFIFYLTKIPTSNTPIRNKTNLPSNTKMQITSSLPEKFISWDTLKDPENIGHYRSVCTEWRALLNSSTEKEMAYLKYLHEHAGFFFHNSRNRLLSISEFEFGSDLRADFVVCEDRASYGFEYEFIEIESPNDNIYTARGNPSAALTTAVNQIQQWRHWLISHREEAKKILPSKSFIVTDQPAFKYTIIIGRRNFSADYLHMRNMFAEQMNIQIRSFDYLTDKLLQRRFDDIPIICSCEFETLDLTTKNQLANPFFTSLKSAEWRKIVKAPSFDTVHMMANNAAIILQNKKANSRLAGFINDWNNLPANVRLERYKRAKCGLINFN